MRVYYLFKINDSFSKLYYNKTYYLDVLLLWACRQSLY